ncbi:Cytosine/adenosine deaminase [bacterium A37T11]|nr:Cytosine/adenosine deaminase [bacterium A37T11]
MRYFSADYVFPVNAAPLRNGVVAVKPDQSIDRVYSAGDAALEGKPVEKHPGFIVPGFINAHCHLELSHMLEKIPRGEGLTTFIQRVMSSRWTNGEQQDEAMEEADRQMVANGIVAVGDHVNTLASKKVKEKSSIFYHTFVEIICFEPEKALNRFREALEICNNYNRQHSSVTPHAPYSVTKEVFRFLQTLCRSENNLISIHNQETEEENKFFRYKRGKFIDFYNQLGRDIDFFKAQARNSLQSITPILPSNQRILLVHNTYTSLKDLYFLSRFNKHVSWCFCPKANLYIEGRLPKIDNFIYHDFELTVGTDSLASNNKLCILSEIKTIHQHFPHLHFNDLLKWATLNGARFLGIDHAFGSIEPGKKPGLNLISGTNGLEITENSTVKKLL